MDTNPEMKPSNEAALAETLKAVLQQMSYLERKIDKLMAQRPAREPSRGRPFSRDSRPPRKGGPSRDRNFPPRERAPRPPKPPEVGVYIRTNLRGEHYANKPAQ